jgi:sulfite exporter TauE/SafE
MGLVLPESWVLPLTMLVADFASGIHCLGMCGGIVSAFSARRVISLRDAARTMKPEWPRQLVFNAGRIASYTAAGTVVGRALYRVESLGRRSSRGSGQQCPQVICLRR